MSKGLEALEIIKRQMSVDDFPLLEHCRVIEKELKRLEELNNGAYVIIPVNRYNELWDKEKALQIIKSIKGLIDEEDLFYDNEENIYYFFGNKITQEKYDLLKEVLL